MRIGDRIRRFFGLEPAEKPVPRVDWEALYRNCARELNAAESKIGRLNDDIDRLEDRLIGKRLEVLRARRDAEATHRSVDGTVATINRLQWERDLYRDLLLSKGLALPELRPWQKKRLGLIAEEDEAEAAEKEKEVSGG